MSNKIINFTFQKSTIRTVLINGEPYFSLRDICCILDINNQTTLKKRLDLKGVVSTDLLTNGGKQTVDFINEKNLYICIFKSKKPEAEKFRDWVFEDVLPTIRKTGKYNINESNYVMEQTDTKHQKQNSKDINTKNYEQGEAEQTIKYNFMNWLLTTGKTPQQVKQFGKEQGLKSNQRSSAKEVLRNLEPEKACAISLTDEFTKRGMDLKEAYELTKNSIPIYAGLIKLGVDLPELRK